MIFRKKTFLDTQIELCESRINEGNLSPKQLGQLLDVRTKLEEQKEKEKLHIDWGKVADISLRIFEVGATVGMTYAGYKMTEKIALMSYNKDEALEMCNSRVWNMKNDIRSLLPKK